MTEITDKLLAQADSLALQAEAADIVAKHFRPRFEACWQDGDLHDDVLALRLRYYVLDQENQAKQSRREATELRDAVTALTKLG